MDQFLEITKTFLAGLILGGVFVSLKLPIPAPPTVSGIMGIVGIFVGFVIMKRFIQ